MAKLVQIIVNINDKALLKQNGFAVKEFLRQSIKETKISLREVGRRSNMSPSTLSRFFKETNDYPRVKTLKSIAQALKLEAFIVDKIIY